MSYTFADCWNLTSIDLSAFFAYNAIYMEKMFYNDYNLVELNLSSFQTNKAKNMNYMFANCYNLVSLDISKFNSSESSIDGIFENSTKLEYIVSEDEKICEIIPKGSQCYSN